MGFFWPRRAHKAEEVGGMTHAGLEGGLPAIGDCRQRRVRVLAQLAHGPGQRVCEVLVLAHAEAIARHVHAAPEARLVRVEGAKLGALGGGQESGRACVTPLVECAADRGPVEPGQTLSDRCVHAARAGLQTLHGR